MSLHLRNPHSILAALKKRPSDVIEIVVSERGKGKTALGDAWGEVVQVAREKRIPVSMARPSGPSPQRHGFRGGGFEDEEGGRSAASHAVVKENPGISIEELFARASEKKGGRGLWLALDTLQDPQNVGAIFRTAAFFGVQGILQTQERSAPLSATVYDVASGGMEHVPFSLQINLQRAFEVAKDSGLWILGTSEHATEDLSSIESDRPWLVVLGNEERGMRRLTEEACDVLCRISPAGQGVTSLNVSVAAGIFISTLSPSRVQAANVT